MSNVADITKHITLRVVDAFEDEYWIATIADPGNTPLVGVTARASHPLVALHELIRLLHGFYDDAVADNA